MISGRLTMFFGIGEARDMLRGCPTCLTIFAFKHLHSLVCTRSLGIKEDSPDFKTIKRNLCVKNS